MFDETENPYAAPLETTDINLAWGEEAASSIPGLRSRSILLMILLCVVTLGLYINYWTHQHAKIINSRLGRERISMFTVILFWMISLTSLGLIVPYYMVEEGSPVETVSDLSDLVDRIFTLVMAFVIRGGLNDLLLRLGNKRDYFGGLWTFLFGIFYLQWKINRLYAAGVYAAEQGAKAASPWEPPPLATEQ